MNFKRMFSKFNTTTKNRLERISGMKLADGDNIDPLTYNQSRTIIQLRNKVHEQDIELMALRFELKDNERLQQENAAVKAAWEQYQIVLTLAKE